MTQTNGATTREIRADLRRIEQRIRSSQKSIDQAIQVRDLAAGRMGRFAQRRARRMGDIERRSTERLTRYVLDTPGIKAQAVVLVLMRGMACAGLEVEHASGEYILADFLDKVFEFPKANGEGAV